MCIEWLECLFLTDIHQIITAAEYITAELTIHTNNQTLHRSDPLSAYTHTHRSHVLLEMSIGIIIFILDKLISYDF